MDEAVEKFRDLVGSLKSWFTSLEDVQDVYLDDITEVERVVPSEGVLARFVHAYDDPPSWIATSLPERPRGVLPVLQLGRRGR